MTKTIQEIQKENRKLILQAIHNCSYEEALQKEWGEDCIITNCEVNGKHMANWGRVIKDNRDEQSLYAHIDSGDQLEFDVNWDDDFKCTIIGKPITLNRVLLAFKNKDTRVHNKSLVFSYAWERFYPLIEDKESGAYPEYKLWNLFGFDWDLTSETLEEQSEETQREINKILKGK